MSLKVTVAAASDAGRIADIHMAAFSSNALLLEQFPTPAIRNQLRDCIAKKAADDIRDPNIAVLVARDQDEIVSFAKWSLPVSAVGTYVEAPWLWPEGTNFSILNEWTEKIEQAQQTVLGELPSYRELPDLSLHINSSHPFCKVPSDRCMALLATLFFSRKNIVMLNIAYLNPGLTFIGTDPQHERRGAATALIQWGLERCCKSNVPAYLESTLNAVPFYERLGFKTRHKISIVLQGSVVYQESCCVYEPCTEISTTEESLGTST